MTTPQLPQPPAPPIPVVTAEPGGRLEQLAAEYEIAKRAATDAEARLNAAVVAIKIELANAQPGQTKVDFHSTALEKPLRLSAKISWRFDSKRFKADSPEVYVRYASQHTTWELRRVS